MAGDLNLDGHQVTYLKEPEHDHMAATKKYVDTKLSLLGGIGMSGNRISHLGKPVLDNDALRLSSGNEYYLRRDGGSWISGDLSLGGFRARGMANPQTDQDGVNLRTLQASEARLLEQATDAIDTVVSDAIQNHHVILDRNIRTKSLDLSPDGCTEKSLNMSGNRIVGSADAETESEAVNLRIMNGKILRELEVNNLLEAQKCLRLDGENQMVFNLQLDGHKIVEMADATAPTDGVNLRTLDGAVKSLATENYVNGLILANNDNIDRKVLLDGATMPTEDINMDFHKLTGLKDPTDNLDAVNLQHFSVDASAKNEQKSSRRLEYEHETDK